MHVPLFSVCMKPIEQFQGWVLWDSSFMGATTHDPWLVCQWSPGWQDSGSGQRQNGTLQSSSLCQAVPVPAYCSKDWATFRKKHYLFAFFKNKKKNSPVFGKNIFSQVLFQQSIRNRQSNYILISVQIESKFFAHTFSVSYVLFYFDRCVKVIAVWWLKLEMKTLPCWIN